VQWRQQPVHRQSQGNDKLLCGVILGVVTFWQFAQTTLNIAPDTRKDLDLDSEYGSTSLENPLTDTSLVIPLW
jgi:hypothetical protein